MSIGLIVGFMEQGFIFALMALGVYITYKILDFPDLSVDGTFPLGAAITARLITLGWNPWLTLLVAMLAGALAGVITGVIHVKFGVKDLLSGIITMTALYSVNLMIAGAPNLPIFNNDNIFSSGVGGILEQAAAGYGTVLVAFALALACKFALDWYLSTKSGLLLRGVGDNALFVTYLGRDEGSVKIVGLAIANALAALSGAVLCQQQRVFDIAMGTGTIVMGLAMVIIGTALFRRVHLRPTTMVLVGAVLYRAVIAFILDRGVNPNIMKLLTAGLLLLVLAGTHLNGQKKGGGKRA